MGAGKGVVGSRARSGHSAMTPERWKQIDQLLEAALECEATQQANLIAKASESDEQLRGELESLLASHRQADTFIEIPASNLAATLLTDSQSLRVVGRTLGRYQIVSLLGSRAMGEVYL